MNVRLCFARRGLKQPMTSSRARRSGLGSWRASSQRCSAFIFRLTVAPKGRIDSRLRISRVHVHTSCCHRILADGWLVLMPTASPSSCGAKPISKPSPSHPSIHPPVAANVQPQSEDCVVPQGQITRPDKPFGNSPD